MEEQIWGTCLEIYWTLFLHVSGQGWLFVREMQPLWNCREDKGNIHNKLWCWDINGNIIEVDRRRTSRV